MEGDHIEDVTDEMLDKLVAGDHPGISSTFGEYRQFLKSNSNNFLFIFITIQK